VFYILTTYAATVAFGPDRFAEFPTAGDGNPWDFLARGAWGAGWVLVFLAVANSAIANSNASANAATRTWFALGRIRLLPPALAHVNPRWRSPDVAVVTQLVVGIGVSLWLGLRGGRPRLMEFPVPASRARPPPGAGGGAAAAPRGPCRGRSAAGRPRPGPGRTARPG
jgi:amino acid transporter